MPDPAPDDPNRSLSRDDAAEDAPDRWAEADRAWEARWSDAPETERPPGPPSPAAPAPRATTTSVADSYLDGMQAAGPYLGLGIQIAASMALFAGGGYLVDRWLGTTPWGLLVGAALGMAGIVALLVRVAREADAQKAAATARKAKK